MNHSFPFTLVISIVVILLIVGFFYYRSKNAEKKAAVENVEDTTKDLFRGEVDSFSLKDGGTLDIFSIKHGTLAMRVAGKWIYVDPVTSGALPETDFSPMPKADYILFTHAHYDHFDTLAVSQLKKDETRVIANAEVVETLGWGEALRNGESTTTAEGWTIEAVPAYNNSPEKLDFHPQGRDNGYVITVDGFRTYVSGDTEVIPELADRKDIDVAFLPCNLPYTMSPEQCAEAARTFMPKVLFPYHYGGTDTPTDLQKLVSLLDGSGIEVRIRQYE